MDGTLEQKLTATRAASRPEILDLTEGEGKDADRLKELFDARAIQNIGDDYEEQLRELFAINNPSLVYTLGFKEQAEVHLGELRKKSPLWQQGRWIFYPWLSTLVHILIDEDFQKVRTARNKNLINAAEQDKFYNAVIGIGGLSVGNNVVLAIVQQGGGKHFRIADFDQLALTNINRIRAGVQNLGLLKTEMTARQIYELNPYAKVEIFSDGLTKENLEKFFAGPPKLDVVIDELDSLGVKLLIREQAKKYGVPLVMAADNGDNAVVDVERYDQDPNLPFFQGRLGDVTYEELISLDKFGIGKTITKHIGPENITPRMQQSLLEMGKTIVSWPQLGGAAWLNGAAVAYCVRKIINDEPVESNRALISLDEKLIPEYNSPAAAKERADVAASFRKMFGL
jgi:molybdopterin/thiamine biosynthesis adenylyltransferase